MAKTGKLYVNNVFFNPVPSHLLTNAMNVLKNSIEEVQAIILYNGHVRIEGKNKEKVVAATGCIIGLLQE